MESRLTALVWGVGCRVEGSSEKKERMDMDNGMVIAGKRGWVEVEDSIRGINNNGKIQ